MWPLVNSAVRIAPENPLTLLPAVQEAVWNVNKSVPVSNPRTMNDIIARTLLQKKFTMLLLTIFAGAALLLAAIGLYGVISYSVAQRTRELGIRIALGAQRSDVLRLILRQGMTLVAAGVLFGVAASLGLTRLIASLLYGISASDPITFFLLSMALVFVAFIACWLPARRASAVYPSVALHAACDIACFKFWGARAPRVLVSTPRRNRLSGKPGRKSSRWRRRHRQHARRVRSPNSLSAGLNHERSSL